ncbi:MAG TPA: Maf family protein [Rhodothermales bacterium]|nr:Maf family protein [Rhodothermales bacterium]
MLTVPLVLASASPRRHALLRLLGVPFTVSPSEIPEVHVPGTEPSALVQHLALEKALAVAHRVPEALVLGADTVVVHDGDVLGKPKDEAEAKSMLTRLSGEAHCVYTGLALVHLPTTRRLVVHETTDVFFAEMSAAEIEDYVATGSPMDKAGAYGIQDDRGALFIRRIEGDYYNVVGLPLHLLYRTLRTHFPDLMG